MPYKCKRLVPSSSKLDIFFTKKVCIFTMAKLVIFYYFSFAHEMISLDSHCDKAYSILCLVSEKELSNLEENKTTTKLISNSQLALFLCSKHCLIFYF